MATTTLNEGLRRTTGALFVVGALAFAGAATVLSSTFDWPDILREPAEVVLPAFAAGGTSLVWTWFATAWTYAILIVPMVLLPTVLGRREDPILRVATYVGATSVVLALIGFLRWVFVVPPLADSYVSGDAVTRAAVDAAWTAQHQFGGALLGEHLGQLLAVAWSVTISLIILRSRVLPRWLGVAGLVVSALYLTNQGDVLATAIPGFPVWDLGGLIGSTSWGLWVASLGVVVLLRPVHAAGAASRPDVPPPPPPAPPPPPPAPPPVRRPPPVSGADRHDPTRAHPDVVPPFLGLLDRRLRRLPDRRPGRHRGGGPRRQPARRAVRRSGRRARPGRRADPGQPAASRPPDLGAGHRRRHGARPRPRCRHRRLPNLPG